jgi:DNA-binding response OmpR family regulator
MLSAEGFDVVVAQDALSGLRAAYQEHPDAILLDVMMPDMDGFDACRRLRDMTDVPIIFVTAKGTIENIVQGLSLGADDYVVKPFERSELLSRLAACLRRAGERTDEGGDYLFPAESVVLDCDRHELVIGNRTVYLTPKEFEVLRLLIRHAGKVLSTDAILTRVWGPDWIGEPDLVKQYVYRLRQKIEPDPSSPAYLHTVRGGGYYFDAKNLL